MSFREMTKFFNGRTASSLQKKALKLGLTSKWKATKNTVNKHFFDLPNLLNSYYMGHFAADGYLKFRGGSTVYALQMNTKDIEIINNFKRDCEFSGPVRSYQRKNYKKETMKDVSYMYISNVTEWREPLKNNFGIIPNKTLRMSPPPLMDEKFKHAYLIGYLDGDGSILFDKKLDRIIIKYYSSNLNIMKWIHQELTSILTKLNYNSRFTITKIENCYSLCLFGRLGAVVFNYLKDIDVPKLKRKWYNPDTLECLGRYKVKYPDLFNKT